MRVSRAAMGCAVLVAIASAQSADKPCTPADTAKAEKSIDNVVTWGQMHKAFLDYSHCDSGAVGDLYTEALMRLVVEWKNVETFAATMQKDAQFRKFVIAHVKSPAAKDDRESIYSRAKASCPRGLDAFCAELADAASPSAAAPATLPAAAPATPPAAAPATPPKLVNYRPPSITRGPQRSALPWQQPSSFSRPRPGRRPPTFPRRNASRSPSTPAGSPCSASRPASSSSAS